MEPIDKWTEGFKEYSASQDPATGAHIIDFDFASLYPSFIKMYNPGSETEEKTPTFNEPRLNPIKP